MIKKEVPVNMISFSANAKAEICRSFPQEKCCSLAECFGILLFCNCFQADNIKIITESTEFAMVLPKLFKKAFGFGFDSYPSICSTGKMVFQIQDPEKISEVMEAFGFHPEDTLSVHINLPVVENSCCAEAFLRGAFLAGGSVTDPVKGYHLELVTTHQSVARECFALIQEAFGTVPKAAARGGSQVLYFKNSEQISDFLAFLGAPLASMGIIEARLEKELNNKVNRRCNCDDANISKVVEAAQEQLTAIRILRERNLFDKTPAKLKQAAQLREENPESSLAELAGMIDPPISKPAMSHRLKKIVELAREAGA